MFGSLDSAKFFFSRVTRAICTARVHIIELAFSSNHKRKHMYSDVIKGSITNR